MSDYYQDQWEKQDRQNWKGVIEYTLSPEYALFVRRMRQEAAFDTYVEAGNVILETQPEMQFGKYPSNTDEEEN